MHTCLGKQSCVRYQLVIGFAWLAVLGCLLAVHPAFAAACPDQTEVTGKYTVVPTPIDPAVFKKFMDAATSRGVRIDNTNLGPGAVAQIVTKQAEAELESYALQRLLKTLCASSNTSPYVPNTCSVYSTSEIASGQLDSAKLQDLKASFRQDVKSLPACLVFQHTAPASAIGYVLMSALEQIEKGDTNDLLAVLNGFVAKVDTKTECVDTQSGGCMLFLAVTAATAALELKQQQSGSGSVPVNQLPVAIEAQLAYTLCPRPAADEKATICANHVLDDFQAKSQTSLSALNQTLRTIDSAGLKGQVDKLKADADALKTMQGQIASLTGTQNKTSDQKSQLTDLQSLEGATLGRIVSDLASVLNNVAPVIVTLYIDPKGTNVQAQQFLSVVSSIGQAQADIKSKDYVAAFTALVDGFSAACEDPKTGKPVGNVPCDYAYRLASVDKVNQPAIKFIADVAQQDDSTTLKDELAAVLAGSNIWAQMPTTRLIWAGGFVGGQGGYEFLRGPGYKASGADYALFAPLGVGFSWPNVLFGKPVAVFASIVDLGSLISTTSASGQTRSTSTKSGWSQTLAPGLYAVTQVFGPIYGGAGYAYRTPGLRQVTLSSGETINLSSSRIEVFIGINISFIGLPL